VTEPTQEPADERVTPTEVADERPTDERLMFAVFRRLGKAGSVDPKVGGKFLALAMRGLSVREHFDAHHPDQIRRGEAMCELLAEADREAWLFGYRFIERKEGA
jgi:hypothetical protein